MLFPVLASSAFIDLSSYSYAYEYPVQDFIEEIREVITNQAPFAEEFFPFIEGAIDVIGFFTEQSSEEFRSKYAKLKNDFIDFCSDSSLLDTVVSDCKNLYKFPRLRFVNRLASFENATEYLERQCSTDFRELSYAERVYIYGAIRALNEIHEDLCDYVCNVYENEDWEDYFDFSDVEKLAFTFLLNPTPATQYNLQLGLAVLKAKIHNL